MTITIAPSGIVFIAIYVIDFFLYNIKNPHLKRIYNIYASVLSAAGLVGMLILRFVLQADLKNKAENLEYIDTQFVEWALRKYDKFMIISYIIIVVLIIVILIILKWKNYLLSPYLGRTLVIVSVIYEFLSVWYTLGTINKYFNLGSYIGMLSFCVISVLHIPIIINRIFWADK